MSRRFIIDLARCTGCHACRIACKDRADLPDDLDLLRIETLEGGAYPTPTLAYRVVHCFHCARPACLGACPVGAITRQEDGLVALDEALCTGCVACLAACPWSAIVLRPDGVAAKCDGCADELVCGGEPTCVRACPLRALGYTTDSAPPANRIPDPSFDDAGIKPAVIYLQRRNA